MNSSEDIRRREFSNLLDRDADKRMVIFLDILGFKNLVLQSSYEQIYQSLDLAVAFPFHLEKAPDRPVFRDTYSSVYFSDTLIIYSTNAGITNMQAHNTIDIASQFLAYLLSRQIPVRGAIAYGSFNKRSDRNGRHELFWGNGLIEASEFEKGREMIGVTICPSLVEGVHGIKRPANFEFTFKYTMEYDNEKWVNPFYFLSKWKPGDSFDLFLEYKENIGMGSQILEPISKFEYNLTNVLSHGILPS